MWPPDDTQADLLGQLALLIERGGASHFLDAAIARADQRDFPEPWQPTATALERLLIRMLWLSYVDLDVEIDDLRTPDRSTKMLQRSRIEWLETASGTARFQVEAIGNDNVAGLLAHLIGRAFMAWLPVADPYRGADVEPMDPTEREGSIAAIYLGLGVVAVNSAVYNRAAGRIEGRSAVTEWEVVVTGGLTPAEGIYLLAVQAVLRGAPSEAHETLSRALGDRLDAAIAELLPHRDALASRLGIDLAATRAALERDPAPTTAIERREPDVRRRFSGQRTYRWRRTERLWRGFAGAGIGFASMVAVHLAGPIIPVLALLGATAIPAGIGVAIGWRRGADYCTRCGVKLTAADECESCGATIAGRVASPNDVSARELERDE